MAVPAFETIGKAPSFDDIPAAAPTDMATMPDEEFPAETRDVATRIRNSYYYARNLGISTDDAWDYEPQINEALYGPGTTSEAAWGRTRKSILGARRKSLGEALAHAGVNAYQDMQKVAAGAGRMIAETEARLPKFAWDKSGLGLADPAFRWLFGVPKDVDVDQFMADLADSVSADINESQQEHPERGYAIDPDAGFTESVWQMVSRPENLVQGIVENVPILLEGVLGTMVAGPAGGAAAMGLPITGKVYQDARSEGTGVLPAFAQAIATGGIEAAIEQWTLGRKIQLGKNINRVLQGGPGRKLLWEGTKAFFRGSAEEGSQQFNQNFWQWLLTDRSQKWFEGVQQAAGMGGPLEAIMSGAFAGAGRVGSPVSPQEAQRRLDVIRKGIRESTLPAEQKQEILDEIDKAVEVVPEIILGKEEAKAREEAARAEAKASETPAAQPAVSGEGGPGVRPADLPAPAPGAEAVAAGTTEEVTPTIDGIPVSVQTIPADQIKRHDFSGAVDEASTLANLPPVPEGHIRLYRGSHPTAQRDMFHPKRGVLTDEEIKRAGLSSGEGGWYTPFINYAMNYAEAQGEGAGITYIDMPVDVANKYAYPGEKAITRDHPSGSVALEYFFPQLRLAAGTEEAVTPVLRESRITQTTIGQPGQVTAQGTVAATPPAATALPETQWGSANTGVTRAEYDAILAARKAKGKLAGGRGAGGTILFNPEEWLELVRVGRFHLEAGARAFAEWAKRMIADFGAEVEPELDKVWKKVQTEPDEAESQLEETTEEAKIAEAKLAGEGAETVEPMLYIGNVTARMKDRAANMLALATGKAVESKDIGPFKEGAWPTKRTKIKMTRAQAEEYLAWLEKDIQNRLKYNLINTYEDMAKANADWGDVKALRRVLGISEKMTAEIKAAKKERTRLKKELKRIQRQQDKPSGPNKMTPARAAERIAQLEKAIANQDDIIASAGRPWRIIYSQKQGTVVRDQGEIKAARQEIDLLRGEFDRAKTDMEAEEILTQIEAKQLEIHMLQKAAGKAAKIIKKTSESVMGSVQPSRLDESKMTVQEVLRAVMKRGARFAKMGHAEGRRELRAELRARAQAKARMQAAMDTIKRAVPATVDVVYRDAIDAIKNSMDPSFRSKKALAKRENTREYLKRHPEKAAEMPTKLLDTLGKKAVNDYTIEELETIAAKIEQLKELGGLRRKLETTQYERGKQKDLQAIAAGSTPITDRDMIRPEKIGEELTFQQRAKNTLSRMLNAAAAAKRAVAMPMDVFFDMLDGSKEYKGANYRVFKRTLDKAYSRYLALRDEMAMEVVVLANELGLQRGNFERIGVHAALQQEGGRQKLLDTGYTDAQIDEVKLTEDELRLYNLMREKYGELKPAIKEVMEVVYNKSMDEVENYFPYMTDFEAMSDFEIRDRFGNNLPDVSVALKKNVESGMAITRTLGTQRIKINAMEIFLQHVDNASYLVEMGADIKRLAELAGTAEYGQAVGDVGQREVREWLDLMARKGKSDRNKSIRLLDIFRKHTGAAMIGFKLSSALVNMTPLFDGAGLIGRYAFQGASDVATNREWRAFLMKNFPELRDRVGGDIEFLEFGNTGLEKAERAGFWLLQKIDGITAASIASGAYQKYLDDNGLTLDFENANPEAVAYAQRIVRRSQSSAFFKDLPSAFTRGTLTGNKSVDRLLLQFQSFILNRWSMIEHDMLRAGIKSGNIGQAMSIFLWLSIAGFAEIGLRRLTKELIAMLTGDELDDWSETFTEEAILNSLQNIPFVSQAVSTYNYGNIPVPTLSLLQDMAEKWETLKRTKDPDKKRLKALELLIMTGGTAAGIPGTLQVSEIVRSAARQQREQKMPKH